MTPLSKEERAGLVAEIAEVEAEIERWASVEHRETEDGSEHHRKAQDAARKRSSLQDRLEDLKRREASS